MNTDPHSSFQIGDVLAIKQSLHSLEETLKACSAFRFSRTCNRCVEICERLQHQDFIMASDVQHLIKQIEHFQQGDLKLEFLEKPQKEDSLTRNKGEKVIVRLKTKLQNSRAKGCCMQLINQAIDEDNLSRMFEGWMAWI